MNPFKLESFFNRVIRNSGFRIFYKSLYDALRLMFLRILCDPAPQVNRLEKELNDGGEKVYQEEKKALEKVENEVAISRERVAYMEKVGVDWRLKERSRWREGIPQLPVWKRQGGTTGKKRARSQSISRSRSVKPKKIKLTSKARKSSVMVPVHPAPKGNCSENKSLDGDKVGENVGERGGGNSEGSGAGPSKTVKPVREGSVLDEYLMEPDDAGALELSGDVIEEELIGSGSCALLTTWRKKSRFRSGSQRSAPARVLTHDELCEDLKRVIEEDEPIGLDGEEIVFEIPPEVEQYNFDF